MLNTHADFDIPSMNDTLSYHKGHPNPMSYRPHWSSLNGPWSFVFDDDDIGIKKRYYEAFPKDHITINVPYAYEAPKSGINDKKEHNILWYRKTFEYHQIKEVTLLHIERSDYITKAWLNGNYLGEHIGGYDAFSFDIKDYLIEGNNELVIRVFDSKDPRQLRGKQTWKETPFECFYHGTSGIYGDVWLESVSGEHISHFEVMAFYQKATINIETEITKVSKGASLVILAAYHGDSVLKHMIPIDGESMSVSLPLPSPLHPWSVETPNLYDLELVIERNGIVLDQVLSYFGINEPSTSERKILLNNKPTFLKFVLDQGYFPGGDLTGTLEDYELDINYLKEAGFNGVRKHEKVEGNLFYYLADRDGLLNWLELPSPHQFDESEMPLISKQWSNIIKQHISHPSLMAYVCYNESWGVHQIRTDKKQQASKSLYELAKRIDTKRFVISNDGWEHTTSDLLTVHNYQESKQELLDMYKNSVEELEQSGNTRANQTRLCYADGYKYNNEPLVFSEVAGIAIDHSSSEGWGYGSPASGVDGFLEKLQGQIEAIKELGIFSGYCITQLTDVYQETNGLMTQDRNIKIRSDLLAKTLK